MKISKNLYRDQKKNKLQATIFKFWWRLYMLIRFVLKISIMFDTSIENLPDEILEYIFDLLPPYEDVKNCRVVNRKWNKLANSM